MIRNKRDKCLGKVGLKIGGDYGALYLPNSALEYLFFLVLTLNLAYIKLTP
jgi:hypothetical protein